MSTLLMILKILIPSEVFLEMKDVSWVIVESTIGSVGFLPHRLDCVVAIVPGVLVYKSKAEGEKFVAIDEGVLIKVDSKILISVRNAVAGRDLGELHAAVVHEFMTFRKQQKSARQVMVKMESNFIQRLVEMRNE